MESKTIESLPDEVLLIIFNMMDVATNLCSGLVCKKWNGMISNSTPASSSMKLVINPSRSIKELNDVSRKFTAIQLNGFTNENAGTLDASELSRKLSFKHLDISKLSMDFVKFEKILTQFESLEKVVICCSYLNDEVEVVPSLKKIKHIELCLSSSKLLTLFSASQITSLDIDTHLYGSRDYLGPYLATQTKLESLKISLTFLDAFRMFSEGFLSELAKAKFKLKHLTISVYGFENILHGSFEMNFIEFLTLHSNHLESLDLIGEFPYSAYNLVFTKFKSLKHLKLNRLPKNRMFRAQIAEFKARQQLVLFNSCPADHALKSILTNLYHYNSYRLNPPPRTVSEDFDHLQIDRGQF